MTISLAFIAPDLVKAAIEGRLLHGMGVARLCDLPAEWSRQYRMLGLAARESCSSNRVSGRGEPRRQETDFPGQRQNTAIAHRPLIDPRRDWNPST
jgi:hypothetical protein